MWPRYIAVVFVLVTLLAVVTQGRQHHWRRRGQRDRTQEPGESTLEVHNEQQQQQQLRQQQANHNMPPWISRLRNLMGRDGFASEFFNPYSSYLPAAQKEPWWEGPNICPREEEKMQNATNQDIRKHFTSRMQFCDESETAYRCNMIEESADGRRETSIIYECCHGFTRQKSDFGCPVEEMMQPLLQTAQSLGLRDFVKAIKLLELGREIQSGNFTVFAPIDGALGLRSNLRDYKPGIMLQDSPSNLIVTDPAVERTVQTLQAALLGHIVPGLHRSSALHDEETLETESPLGSTLRINYFDGPEKLMTVNCIRVVSRDHMATNGVIHSVEGVMKPVTGTLMDLVKTRRELSMLKTILAKADYVYELDDEGKFTLMAPSDNAFAKMDKRLRERLLRGDRKCLQRVLHNHILPNVICSSAIQGNAHTPNLLRKYINVTRSEDSKLFVEHAQIVEKDVMGSNGVMHVIDEVLVPDEAHGILQVLEKQGFTELLKLMETAGLTDTLDSVDNVTMFAPTNEAIEALSDAQKSRLTSDPDMLRKVLLFHLSPGETNCQHFYDSKLIPSSEGRQIRLTRYTNFMYPQFNVGTAHCAPMTGQGFVACNGNIKVISKVMMPPGGNAIDVLAKDKRFSTFLSLVKKAGLADKLQENGPFTVFAPSNKAFEKIDDKSLELLSKDTDKLSRMLKGHVFDGFICCARINRGWVFSYPRMHTLAGTSLRLTRDVRGAPKVGHANVVNCDRTATNGNVMELDRVLIYEMPRRRFDSRWNHWRHRWA